MRRGGATYYYVYTARGDITAVVNSSGAIVNTYTYTPWGKMGSVSEQVENPFRYASYRYDTETGLYYLQNRYYNPDLMRFITRDAIRDQIADPNTSNYYHYADGNPVMKVDPDGLWGKRINLGFGGYIQIDVGWRWIALSFNITPGMLVNLGISVAVGGAAAYAIKRFINHWFYYYGNKLVFVGATWLVSKAGSKLSSLAAKKSFGVVAGGYNWLSRSLWSGYYKWSF